jgi:hypothetical protein
VPLLALQDPVNVSPAQVLALNKIVQDQAKSHLGSAMIYDVRELLCFV